MRSTRAVLVCGLLAAAGACNAAGGRPAASEAVDLVAPREGKHLPWPGSWGDEGRGAMLADGLDEDEAVWIALLSNPSLRATWEEIGIGEADLVQSGLLQNPLVHASPQFGTGGSSGVRVEYAVVQTFVDALQIPLRRRVARSDLRRTVLRVADATLEVARDARVAFVTLQAREQMLAGERSALEAHAAAAELARRQHEAGNISEIDRMEEEDAWLEARLALRRTEAQARLDREALIRVLGLETDDGWPVVGPVPDLPRAEPDLAALEALAVAQRLDLAAGLLLGCLFLLALGGAPVRADEPEKLDDAPHTPVTTPNGTTLPWRIVDGVKVGHLVAEPVRQEIAAGVVLDVWGYNGHSPGPTIEAVEGDRVRIYVTNRLPAPTSVHWHGMLVPNGMDGVAGLTQRAIPVGETYKYEFTLRQHGTQMYHPHFDEMVQIGMGMMGFFVIHPRERADPPVERDFCVLTHEWFVEPGSRTPDPAVMLDFNVFTFNGHASPATEPLVVRRGQRVRIRLGNLSMNSHPIHQHGYQFRVTGTDGGPIPRSAQGPETTVNVPVGATRDIEFVADEPGDWALHCHKTHHTMNQMGHELPNLLGVSQEGVAERIRRLLPGYRPMGTAGMVDMGHAHGGGARNTLPMGGARGPFGSIDMGGMFTVLKVREGIGSYEDPGWYDHPPGTVAEAATEEELARDLGVEGGAKAPAPAEKRPAAEPAEPAEKPDHDHGGH